MPPLAGPEKQGPSVKCSYRAGVGQGWVEGLAPSTGHRCGPLASVQTGAAFYHRIACVSWVNTERQPQGRDDGELTECDFSMEVGLPPVAGSPPDLDVGAGREQAG